MTKREEIWNNSCESEWYWSKLWKVNLTTYESDPENTVFPPISLFNGCSVWNSDILRLVRLCFIEHIPSSVSISFVTSKKHKFWQSRSSVSSFDSFWFLRKWYLIYLLVKKALNQRFGDRSNRIYPKFSLFLNLVCLHWPLHFDQ